MSVTEISPEKAQPAEAEGIRDKPLKDTQYLVGKRRKSTKMTLNSGSGKAVSEISRIVSRRSR